ncbi:Ttc29 [Scenedesmus sp. PABB004]|nr:Ttc29 [Scenedesmus sp. PABB004]
MHPPGRGRRSPAPGALAAAAAHGSSASPARSVLKAKLAAAVAHAAGAAAAAAAGEAPQTEGAAPPPRGGAHDRRRLAVALLTQGRPEAFVDFFMLTAPSTGDADGAQQHSSGGGGAQPPAPSLALLSGELAAADEAMRRGAPEGAFASFAALARHFAQLGALDRAAMFWSKCLKVAADGGWREGELQASCALGLLCESLGRPRLAVGHHERCLVLARALGRDADAAAAAEQLVQVYAQQAEECAAQGDAAGAAAHYVQCRDAALLCGDATSAGAASHHLGLIHQAAGEWEDALECQRRYLELAREAGDAEAEGRACAAYAQCQQRLGQLDGAVASLESLLGAPRSQDLRGQALACCALGALLLQRGELAAAVGHCERFFEIARSLGERRLLDVARVNLGAARAALRAGAYERLAWDDGGLPALLAWKCRRQPF